MQKKVAFISILVTSLGVGPGLAAQQSARPPQTAPAPDSTKVNKQGGKTADDQSQTKEDLDLVKRVRQAIVKDKSLSTSAHNCKVITRDGVVTLRGPVNSSKEKTTVERLAEGVAGEGKVKNELVVKASK